MSDGDPSSFGRFASGFPVRVGVGGFRQGGNDGLFTIQMRTGTPLYGPIGTLDEAAVCRDPEIGCNILKPNINFVIVKIF